MVERNVGTLENVRINLSIEENQAKLVEDLQQIIDTLKRRDNIMQYAMQVMEERFEKVWDIPWSIVGIIHGYTWKWDDLLRISSNSVRKVFYPSLMHFFRTSHVILETKQVIEEQHPDEIEQFEIRKLTVTIRTYHRSGGGSFPFHIREVFDTADCPPDLDFQTSCCCIVNV